MCNERPLKKIVFGGDIHRIYGRTPQLVDWLGLGAELVKKMSPCAHFYILNCIFKERIYFLGHLWFLSPAGSMKPFSQLEQ